MNQLSRLAVLILLPLAGAAAQISRWQPQVSGTEVRFRAVSAVSETVAWASGARGTYARTTDGGRTWQPAVVPGAESLDFRDVEAFDERTAYLLSIGAGEASRIYKTVDGGGTWQLQFQNANPDAFFDAIAFWNERNGIAMSDPVNGRFLIVGTADGGKTWAALPGEGMPRAREGEAAFAASGTCLVTQGSDRAWLASGAGGAARVFRTTDRGRTWQAADTPIPAASASSGVFGLAFRDARHGIAVGGDYRQEAEVSDNVAVTADGGVTWTLAGRASGFRSGAAWLPAPPGGAPALIVVGPSGSDYSTDGARTWTRTEGGFHAISVARRGRAAWAVGERGSIGNLVIW
jgi:photosystem II stability/assembly factor-like uncharacterized protein